MTQQNGRTQSPLGALLFFVLVIVLPLVVGIFVVAPHFAPKPKIGIIRLYYDINPVTAAQFKAELALAQQDPSIQAVVVVLNSPGGTASDSEEIYLELLNTRRDMPVVATVDFLAASGAYYIAAGADEIYAKTSSIVGSIGVIGILPGESLIEDDTYTTGPFKGSAFTRDTRARQIETLKLTFLEAIRNGRGDRLTVDLEFLSRAEVYSGLRAEEMGLIDGIASTDDAIERAAELAGLRDYETVELFELLLDQENEDSMARFTVAPVDTERLWAMPNDLPPGMYYRYIVLGEPQ